MKSRIIARLDIKKDRLIKGIHLEGLRVVGDPVERAKYYYQQGADELLLIDAVASLYQRNQLAAVVQNICKEIFVPITVGGGIRSLEDAQALFDVGADKIAINTAAIDNPTLLAELSRRFGSQAIVLSVQAQKNTYNPSNWLAMTDYGRENSGRDVFEWIHLARQYGVGEILLTSIDQEGTGSGFDIALNSLIASSTDCPVLASGGFNHPDHATAVLQARVQAVVIAQALHYDKITIQEIKDSLSTQSISVRAVGNNGMNIPAGGQVSPRVCVINYGAGNMASIRNALHVIGIPFSEIEEGPIASCEDTVYILPGVGSFFSAMESLKARRLTIHPSEQPRIIGICLGMQLLLQSGTEGGFSDGLSLLEGMVVEIRTQPLFRSSQLIPHVGWQSLKIHEPMQASRVGCVESQDVYFVHSFMAVNLSPQDVVASIAYGDLSIPAIVSRGSVIGFQFHPEKSGPAGLSMLRRSIFHLASV